MFVSSFSPKLEAIVVKLQQVLESVAPAVFHLVSEFEKWRLSSEMLGKAGWLPHYTMPPKFFSGNGERIEIVRNQLLEYYKNNWHQVRSEIETRLSDYDIDIESKETFREALDAHEVGLYRSVCRVLFPEIERVLRLCLYNGYIRKTTYSELINKLVSDDRSIDAFIHEGLYELSIFEYLIEGILDKEESGDNTISKSNNIVFGVFKSVTNKDQLQHLKQNPMPNRHAVIHGLVSYSSQQSSLNTVFLTEYVFKTLFPKRNEI